VAGYLRLVRDLTDGPGEAPRWPQGVTLAPFNATLAPAAHALLVECYCDGYGSVPVAFDTWWATTRHDPEFDASLCFCAMRDGRLVGFALCWTSAFIKDFVVAPEGRRQGLGAAMLQHILAAFRARGAGEVALKVVEENAAALRLYHRLGFRQ
jgi:ribosomal protein S18 acetylase RimI-like enzyme